MAKDFSNLLKLGMFFCLFNMSFNIQAAPRIIGGEEVTAAEAEANYPWMVSLRGANSGAHLCGGSLIAANWVLSAAHCFYTEAPEAVTVYVGDYDLTRIEDTEQRIDVVRRVEFGGDLVLLELAESVDTTVFKPIKLADEAVMASLGVGDMVTVVGWGDRDALASTEAFDNIDLPDKLHEVELPIYSQHDCGQVWDPRTTNEELVKRLKDGVTTKEELDIFFHQFFQRYQ